MNKKSSIPLILAALALAGCGGGDKGPVPVRVKLEPAAAISGAASSYYSGIIEARNSIQLSFLTPGTISGIQAREGQSVEKGQLLASLDCRSNDDAMRMAEAKAKQAQDAWRRFEPMYKNGNLPEIKMVEIETAKTEAELSLKLAAKNAGDCRLTAPAGGVISSRQAEPGATAVPGKPVLRLDVVDQVYASIAVPEGEISSIRPGTWAEVEVAALTPGESGANGRPGYRDTPSAAPGRLRGVVADSGVSADPLSRTYTVRILLNNPGRRILPGMLCNVYTAAHRRGNMVLVPATAINLDDGNRPYVYIVAPGARTAAKRIVETAGFARGGVVISEGIKAGEAVVSEGAQKLSNGAAVEAD